MNQHSKKLYNDFVDNIAVYEKLKEVAYKAISDVIEDNHLYITAIEARVKNPKSLAGKLDLKGDKYKSINDITDLVGLRVITFYTDEVDKIASLVEKTFIVDWENSVDKRQIQRSDKFGYLSLHYICSIPEDLYRDPEHPELNTIRFEVQMRTALQHVWSTVNHDTGYKSDIEIPKEYMREMARLAGLIELADEQFNRIIRDITDYRRKVQELTENGDFSALELNGDSFKSYLKIKPFADLNSRIASINRAELVEHSYEPYMKVFMDLGVKTLADIEKIKEECSDDAYRLAVYHIGGTDLDILSETIGVQNLCIVKILRMGYGVPGLVQFFRTVNGESKSNESSAKRTYRNALELGIVKEV